MTRRTTAYARMRYVPLMYLGHLAAGLALKARVREAPLAWLLATTVISDVVCGVLLITGAEHVAVHGSCVKFADAHAQLTYSHSLTATLVLAAAAGLIGGRYYRSLRIGVALAIGVLSHYVLDVVTHRPDMPVIGFGVQPDQLLGTNLATIPFAHYALELVWCLLAWALLDRSNRRLLWTMLALMALYINTLFAFWCLPPQSSASTGISMLVLFIGTPFLLLWAARPTT